jgi:hypothetical protein
MLQPIQPALLEAATSDRKKGIDRGANQQQKGHPANRCTQVEVRKAWRMIQPGGGSSGPAYARLPLW